MCKKVKKVYFSKYSFKILTYKNFSNKIFNSKYLLILNFNLRSKNELTYTWFTSLWKDKSTFLKNLREIASKIGFFILSIPV